MVSIYARSDTAALATQTDIRFNGDTGANYDYQTILGAAATASAAETFAATLIQVGNMPANTATANLFSSTEVFIPHYAGSSNNKQVVAIHAVKFVATTGNLAVQMAGGSWRSNAAINQITLLPQAGNFAVGTRVTVHALGA